MFFLMESGGGNTHIEFYFEIIRTQIRIPEDLNLGGWIVHPLPDACKMHCINSLVCCVIFIIFASYLHHIYFILHVLDYFWVFS